MSEVKSYSGRLKPIKLKDETIEEYSERKCHKLDIHSFRDCYDSWVETLESESSKYFWDSVNEILYKVKLRELQSESFIEMHKNETSGYDFVTSFYNGGTCLKEMLQEGLDSF